MTPVVKLSRRDFLRVSAGAGAGLWLGFRLEPRQAWAATPATFAPNAFLSVDPSGQVTVWVIRSEMGQGVHTSMPMLVAEELECDWKSVRIQQAPTEPRFGQMSTGGSRSVRGSWTPLRQAGAAAREMLVLAAAVRWGVEPRSCRAEAGKVIHDASGRTVPYGALVAAAAKLPVPKDPPLKDPKDFRLLGKPIPRLDTPSKVNGKAVFGIDVRVPGMLFATVARPPVVGGTVAGFDGAKARKVPGVRKVVQVPSGVAVLASSTWAAIQGREALEVRFDDGPNGALDSAAVERLLSDPAAKPKVVRADGDLEAALGAAAKKLEAVYQAPFLAHATMEPMNCTARVTKKGAELWVPTQAPTWAQGAVAKALDLPESAVAVHTTLLGGGFGRRAIPDFSVEAAQVARAAGAPVQVVWTREDDLRHDLYRPASRHELRAGLDGDGRLVAWHHRVRAPSIAVQLFGGREGRPDVVEGAADVPYGAGTVLVDCVTPEVGLRVGWWRSVYASQNAFAEECFIDECAAAAGKDPVAFRRELLAKHPRHRGVVELAAEKAGWGASLPPGRGRGIASYFSFGSWVAEVAEVSLHGKEVRVHRVVAAVDCGRFVNPDTVQAQVESAVAFGLSAALRGEITLERGRVKQGNFDDYEPLRLQEMPAVEVHLVPSTEDPGGIGEPGLPPIAPAVANAVFAVTGQRLRRMPLRVA
ncbi:MAG TPA: xanthine dehydrogenase family protein molybdopterin-binding subunit [Anaeromyxobacteraceae bacterium]|nr:xanthine dehydrogenase family protein molybdopterin-binding subunit [Anaeromyxobacteraceae bacterium]